ncbi:3(2),5 -bisphosphate nucleotidase [Lentisphaera araneosa HTCC2155]|uniref:3'(2'),5'-bisphosphate nucleotidase CysQ n=1 Tax=Lentisphaera araneosa HTCC2155 TaxID=313628 RepID=A6DQG0_9BACT|nr:3'(2'),5'-bisphosphate nucleotidase CysQ [Lentisphaera araneosa]EDM26041.1 3(2),5 -bisphosphate nucleotidase [Lentisphaera araneosa HTCC2155]
MLKKLEEIARLAGAEIMKIYATDFAVIEKEDKSPLTEADKAANAVICAELAKNWPDIPILSEEIKNAEYSERKDWKQMFVVDPIDGTKEFIKKNGEFTVNIALVENGVPTVGVVYAPAIDDMYAADESGASLNDEKLPLQINETPEKSLTIVASRSHMSQETQDYVDSLKETTESIELTSVGSSLKLCYVASGKADQYPRLAPTMEWDTAAAHAVALAAGKQVLNFETRQPLQYNKENLLNPWFLVK